MDTKESGVPSELKDSASYTALNEYLSLMEESEAPRIYVTWSLLAASAGLIGRNAAFRRGPLFKQAANLFVILLGPAAVRKTSAINQVETFLHDSTINLGPTDTGGQRHGIMSSMIGLNRFNVGKRWTDKDNIPPLHPHLIKPRNPADILLLAPELGRLLGVGNKEMADFFVDLFDGAKIDYQTKSSETIIHKGLASLLGATTPVNLADILPSGATGHGILSRILFIYADHPYKSVPIPPVPDEDWWEARDRFKQKLSWIDHNRLDFAFDSAAEKLYESLYGYQPALTDPRQEDYKGRRGAMLLKVSMILCALRSSVIMNEEDVLLAHALLREVEPNMHKALEYFGKNKAFVGRMLILQFLRARPDHMGTRGELIAAAMSELNKREADEAIDSMLQSKELGQIGDRFVLTELAGSIKGMGSNRR